MAIGDIKTFDIVYQGLTLQIVAVDNGGGTVDFTVTSLLGSADINAVYWNDGDATGGEGILFGFTGAKSESSLNMNGSGEAWDGGVKLSSAGIGPLGEAKPTYLQQGESYTIENVAVSWNDIDTLGVRATSTSTQGGSIKGVDGDAVVTEFPTITIEPVTVTEGGEAVVNGALGNSYPYDITVTFTLTNNGTTTSDDYTAPTLTVIIPAGDTTFSINIPTVDDLFNEGTETLTVTLTSAVPDVPGDTDPTIALTDTALVTIEDNDNAPVASDDVWVLSDTAILVGTITPLWFTNNDTDLDSDTLYVTEVAGLTADGAIGATGLTADFDGDGVLVGISGPAVTGGYTLSYTLSDGTNTDTGSVSLTVVDTTDANNTVTLTNNDFSYISGQSGVDTITGPAQVGDGNAGIDIFNGDGGNDTLNGGAGNDTLNGGAGDDTLNGNAGDDTLNGNAGNDNLMGGDNNDTLNGNLGNDVLRGNVGNDTLNGGEDGDTLFGGAGDDTLNGNAGLDTLNGGDNNDTLNGNNGVDTLNGDAGNDTLNGGAGNDILAGGEGDDTFIFAVGDSGVGSGNRDIITDFHEDADPGPEKDAIDLDLFDLSGYSGTTATADSAWSGVESGNTIIYVDTNGDTTADFEIQLTGTHTLASTDFIL